MFFQILIFFHFYNYDINYDIKSGKVRDDQGITCSILLHVKALSCSRFSRKMRH